MSVKNVYKRGNTHYYQRKIPKDLVHRYGGAVHIKENLKTSDVATIARKVKELNTRYENLWDALRADPSITPSSLTESARLLLKQHGLEPLPATNEEIALDLFFKGLEDKGLQYVGGDEQAYNDASASEFLSATEMQALKLLNEKPQFLLSDAIEVYLKYHDKSDNPRFKATSRRNWNSLINITGDKPFNDFTRADANHFIEKLLDSGAKTTTVHRQTNSIKAVFSKVIAEKEILRANPFAKIVIKGLGKDAIKRTSFTTTELKTLIEACKLKDDPARWLLALQIDLGCRIGEATGLAMEDLKLDVPIPYVKIQPHPWRTLKTANSERTVPLVGVSLWAAKRILESKTKDQMYAFPQYTDGGTCKADGASATLNKWMNTLGLNKTTHELRHTMRDRLRNANVPTSEIDAIGGWGKSLAKDNYGEGWTLEFMQGLLQRIV